MFKQENENVVYGRNCVLELLKAGKRQINKVLISQTARGKAITDIIKLAKEKGIAVYNVSPDKLDSFSDNSQGIAAYVSPIEYMDIKTLIDLAKKNPKPLIVILDSIEDPHNLGAIIRNCVAFGADGVILPKWRAAGISETVAKTSAGAIEHINISRVANINQTIDFLKECNFWIAGVENGNKDITKSDLPFPLAIVIGSEGLGLHRLTKEKCDYLISISQKNTISSLNASCASAIILYEISKNR
ncbi:MAG: 23S rRNA (guanosine(2251)-2'-O)-methyltransferase RlmB [Elusimicrobiota bacterium]|jgi:23S rRNA (guanosine2251-2'-O)-methyltransferase|nr:23S rRNA (guanosine(2251)-2'-O)-methyltransferase RlmB [Elusimicrobiota bacterium]